MKALKIHLGLGLALVLGANSAQAGCIGPTIMGKCQGSEVLWDTHPIDQRHPDPPPGFYWDWRGTKEYRQNPYNFDPFTGREPHDSHWHDSYDFDPWDSSIIIYRWGR